MGNPPNRVGGFLYVNDAKHLDDADEKYGGKAPERRRHQGKVPASNRKVPVLPEFLSRGPFVAGAKQKFEGPRERHAHRKKEDVACAEDDAVKEGASKLPRKDGPVVEQPEFSFGMAVHVRDLESEKCKKHSEDRNENFQRHIHSDVSFSDYTPKPKRSMNILYHKTLKQTTTVSRGDTVVEIIGTH